MEMNKKGQGSLEYLLIIGGGILVAVIIIGAIISLAGTGTDTSSDNVRNSTCNTFLSSGACLAANPDPTFPSSIVGNTQDCTWDGSKNQGLRCTAFVKASLAACALVSPATITPTPTNCQNAGGNWTTTCQFSVIAQDTTASLCTAANSNCVKCVIAGCRGDTDATHCK